MELSSPAFQNEGQIPDTYTCHGQGISPPLNINNIPPTTQSLVLVVTDPDAPSGEFTHWTVWNMSGTTSVIKENSIPSGATQGLNDFKKMGYGAPCPPTGTHRYFFTLYALNTQLSLEEGAHAYALTANLEGHVVAKAQLIGTCAANK
jgi:Raf kinase inhibitor-like YbhB/YbcL family protein